MATTYGIIGNCNFESRADATGRAVHAAVRAVEHGRCNDGDLVSALDSLEATLEEHATSDYTASREACREAEQAGLHAFASAPK